jgi:hypothetical protein
MSLIAQIELYRDYVEIENCIVKRPNYLGVGEWCDFWQKVLDWNEDFFEPEEETYDLADGDNEYSAEVEN